jgi:hypothetical protein
MFRWTTRLVNIVGNESPTMKGRGCPILPGPPTGLPVEWQKWQFYALDRPTNANLAIANSDL